MARADLPESVIGVRGSFTIFASKPDSLSSRQKLVVRMIRENGVLWVEQTAPVGQFDLLTLKHTPGVPSAHCDAFDWLRLEIAQAH